MTNAPEAHAALRCTACYEIRVESHLSDRLITAFPDAAARHLCDGTTLLRVPIADQAALHAVLRTVRDLGLTLRHVALCDPRCHGPPR